MARNNKVSIIVLGDSGVGKTSLLLRYTTNTFKENLPLTMIDCFHKTIKLMDKEVKLELWDTAGQDRFRAITKQYYRIADGVILVYDVTNIVTFHKLSSWLDELRATNAQAKVIIVGNKNDDMNAKNVSVTQIKSYAEQEGVQFVETSAKRGKDVDIVFDFLVTKILQAKGIIPQSSFSSQQTSPGDETTGQSSGNNSASSKETQRPLTTLLSGATSTKTSATNNKTEIVSQTIENGDNLDSLPPVVPVPQDCIKLHVDITRKEQKRKCACA